MSTMLAACSASTGMLDASEIHETATASIDLAVGRSLRATLTLENDGPPVNLIWGNDCSGFGDAITVRAYKHGSSVVAWSSDRLPNALLCPTVAHGSTLDTGASLQLTFVAGVDRVLGDTLPGGTYDITVTPRVVTVDGDENTAGSLTLATGVVAPNGTPLDGTWTGSSRGVTVSFNLHWTADSVSGTGTWSVTGANTLGCGGGTLSGAGTVAFAAHRTGDQLGGSTQFSNGWTPPFLGVLADPNTLGAHFMSVDAGPCPITLARK
jgi:hypothetical protein